MSVSASKNKTMRALEVAVHILGAVMLAFGIAKMDSVCGLLGMVLVVVTGHVSPLRFLFAPHYEMQVNGEKSQPMSEENFNMAKALCQALQNCQERSGKRDVPEMDLYREYAHLIGAEGCPCNDCMKKQRDRTA